MKKLRRDLVNPIQWSNQCNAEDLSEITTLLKVLVKKLWFTDFYPYLS